MNRKQRRQSQRNTKLALLYLHSGGYAAVLGWLDKARHAASTSDDRDQVDQDIQYIEHFVKTDRARH
jgi:hypothetical protein